MRHSIGRIGDALFELPWQVSVFSLGGLMLSLLVLAAVAP